MNVNQMLAPFRAACRKAFDSIKPFATPFELPLPGREWEPCFFFEGIADWRRLPCPVGRMVEFRAEAGGKMAMHFHDSPEVLHVTEGRLVMMRDAQTIEIRAGKSFVCQSGRPHSAYVAEAGACICWWPEQTTDTLHIGVV